MAKHIAFPARQIAPPGPAMPKLRMAYGHQFHDADGSIESPAGKFAASDLLWGYEVAGATVFSVGKGLAFVGPDGRVRGLQFVAGRGWHDTTKVMEAAFANASANPRRRRLNEFVSNLFSSHERIGWVDVVQCHYSFLTLGSNGAVEVNGKPMHVGESPIALGNSWFISQPGDGQVQLADVDGVFDRYRYVLGKWQRLVKHSRVPWASLQAGVFGTALGELVFTAEGVPSLIIAAGKTFRVHLPDGRSLMRFTDSGSIYALKACDNKAEEYVCEGRKIWERECARDNWSYELFGIPGDDGEKPVLFKEVSPGVFLYANGKIEVVHRAFFGGELIKLQCGGVTIRRAGGGNEPMYTSANGIVLGYAYAASGAWYKMMPISPDQKFFAWRRCLGQQNPIDLWVAHADIVIGETRGLRLAGLATAAVWRFVKAADSEPCFAPFSFVIVVLVVMVLVARAALLLAAAPINCVCRLYRRLRRALQLTR